MTTTSPVRRRATTAAASPTKSGTKKANELPEWDQAKIDALTEDARCAVVFWHANPHMVLTFNTPSRIHPRMRKALTELVYFGAVEEEHEPPTIRQNKPRIPGAVHFRVHNRAILDRVPKLSRKEQKRVGLPITVEGSTAAAG